MSEPKKLIEQANGVLLLLVCLIVFVVPVFPSSWHQPLYIVLLSLIFFVAVMAVRRNRRQLLVAAVVLFVSEWIVVLLDLPVLTAGTRILNVLFFFTVVVMLIRQIARTRRVTVGVILEAINSYVLLGLALSLLVAIIMIYDPAAYNFTALGESMSQYTYYGFVTFTTLGYGDLLPMKPYTKSLAILTSILGQLYVAVIIALLVGKYAGGAADE
jgi:hypothetical protein